MNYIKQDIIEKIYDAADIVEVVGEFVDLKKSGVNYKGLCPFHQDHTPSLSVSPSRQIFKCFTCGEGGNAVTFLMKHEKMTYPEALRWLAKKYSIDIQECELTEEQEALMKKRESLFANMAIVEDYYHKEFMKSEKAQQYAYDRWDKEYCDLIRIGYAPGYSRNLDKLGITQDTLKELGLCDRNGNDLIRERITISIRDRFGRIIGFTCRNFDGCNPKYLNNADSDIFHKGEVLFGIDAAWKEIIRTQTAYLVEGAPDCMRLQSIDVTNSVACLGSAWNEKHFQTLSKAATKVCFIPDSDVIKPGEKLPHGIKVVTDAGRLAFKNGLAVYVKEIPAGDGKRDADSYFTNREIFDSLPEQDFILWYAEKLFASSTSVDDQTIALHTVVNILTGIGNSTKVDFYIDQLKKHTGGQKKPWNNAMKQSKVNAKTDKRRNPIVTNTADSREFGFTIRDCQYLIEDENGIRPLSNFILTPMFHVQDPTLSRRIFTIENTQHVKNIIELRSEELVSNDKFEAKVGEIGNYVWSGGKSDLKKVKGFLFANMDTAILIKQLGWQQQGFFAFGNGIFDGEQWHEADQYGIVKLQDVGNFYLPSHSLIYRHDRKMFLFEHNFVHQEGSSVTLREVTDQMFKVFGANGQIAFMFLVASLFHDIVAYATAPGWFPILDLFGPMGTGKTALAEMIAAFFTKKKSINIDNATVAAMSDEVAAAANAVVVFNEYKNALDDSKIEFLKGIWDLIGRTRMSMNKDGQKEMTAVDSGVIITGQEMPTKDPALFSRTIFLTFSKSKFSAEETEEFDKIAGLRRSGLTHLTMEIMSHRDKMEREYERTFDEVSKEILKEVGDSTEHTRIARNWAVPLAAYKVLKDELDINIDYASISRFVMDAVKRQAISCKTSDELASFWNVLQYLLSDKKIIADGHFRIALTKNVTCRNGKEYLWDEPHSILLIRKAGMIERYQETCRKIGYNFIPKESLEFYMKNTSYYLGDKKYRFKEFDKNGYPVPDLSKPNGDKTFKQKEFSEWAYCFDYEKVKEMYDIDLERMPVEDESDAVQTSLDI